MAPYTANRRVLASLVVWVCIWVGTAVWFVEGPEATSVGGTEALLRSQSGGVGLPEHQQHQQQQQQQQHTSSADDDGSTSPLISAKADDSSDDKPPPAGLVSARRAAGEDGSLRSLPAAYYAGYPATPVPRPPRSVCDAQLRQFEADHNKALSALDLSKPVRFELPFRMAEEDAFCGRYRLFNLTKGGEMWHAVGGGLTAATTTQATTVSLYNCAAEAKQTCSDLHLTARLTGPTIIAADVVKRADACAYDVTYAALEPGTYKLHIKLVHLNGTDTNPKSAISLGLDRSRVRQEGRKLFARHFTCAAQRHIQGSPFDVVVSGPAAVAPLAPTPLCKRADYTRGRWVPFNRTTCELSQPYCEGKPWWLSDAYGYNTEWLWAPADCHYKLYSPPNGPEKRCFDRSGYVGIVGDSIAREFAQNCRLFHGHLKDHAGFRCDHWHMIVNGDHFNEKYAADVARVIVDKVHSDKPLAIVVNLGMMHMIGMCTDDQWEFLIRTFAELLAKRPITFKMRRVWLGAPQVHYATRGMTNARAERWDGIAMRHLGPLGFELFASRAVTLPKEEGSWDGLHNAAEKGHKQSKVRNKRVHEYKWNGGVSSMLWNILLNMLCNDSQ